MIYTVLLNLQGLEQAVLIIAMSFFQASKDWDKT